jgi:hypothetical protein
MVVIINNAKKKKIGSVDFFFGFSTLLMKVEKKLYLMVTARSK